MYRPPAVMDKGTTPSRAKSPSRTPQQSAASSTTQRSLKRNHNKPSSAWPVSLLQIAIQARGISGLSRERSSLVLEKALAGVDKVWGRPSPYYADLEDKTTGETPASKPLTASPETVEVPETLVMAMLSAIRSGASINPKKTMDWEENAYLASRILEVIADEDRASGAGVTTTGRRKSKHCVTRAVELMVAERFRERLAASRTRLSRTELDNKETGNKRSVYFELWKDFKDTDVEVVTHLNDDEHITAAQIDPNIVHQPDNPYDKFMNMVKEVNKDYGVCHHNMKKSGNHDEWYFFCHENLDTYYFGQVMAEYPQVLAVCDRLLPEDGQRESSGVGGAAAGPTGAKGAAADAKRREDSKRRAREDNSHLKANKKLSKNAGSVQETTAVALHSVAPGLGLPPGGLSELFRPEPEPAPAAAPSSRDIVDEKTAKLAFFDTLFKSFQAAPKILKEAKAEAAGGDSTALELVGFLEKNIAKIRTEMAEWDKSPLRGTARGPSPIPYVHERSTLF